MQYFLRGSDGLPEVLGSFYTMTYGVVSVYC